MNESEVLLRVRAIFDQRADSAGLVVGNGDDAAVFQSASQVVVGTDMAVEDVHFKFGWSSPIEVGRKITVANLADICAMGGWPKYLLVSVAFAKHHLELLEELATGIHLEAGKVGAKVIGGDLSSADRLFISITAIGETENAIRRSGAQVGDLVMISHLPGWSAAGLEILQSNNASLKESSSALVKRALQQHRAPEIDYLSYRNAYSFMTAATDISDGLLVDAAHLSQASAVALHINSEALQSIDEFAQLEQLRALIPSPEQNNSTALEWVYSSGEEHALLATGPRPIAGMQIIGKVESGSGVLMDGHAVKESQIKEGKSGFQHHW